MAEEKPISFDDIIAEGRKKRKAEALAQKLLGSGRRSSAPAPLDRKVSTGAGTLASRAGVSKPSSTAPRTTFGTKPVHGSGQNTPRGPRPVIHRASSNPAVERRGRAIQGALNGGGGSGLRNQANIRGASNSGGISIRGMGGAYTVIAQNFAPGTTAADIEAVLAPDKEEDGLIRCRLVASNPTVIAELVFTRKDVADRVISTYNNKKADGRLLHVWLKDPQPQFARKHTAPNGAGSTVDNTTQEDYDMEVDDSAELERVQRSREREEAHMRRAQPEFQDGRYGFSESSEPASRDDYRDDDRDRRGGRRDGRERGHDNYDRDYDNYETRGRGNREGGLRSDGMISRRAYNGPYQY